MGSKSEGDPQNLTWGGLFPPGDTFLPWGYDYNSDCYKTSPPVDAHNRSEAETSECPPTGI